MCQERNCTYLILYPGLLALTRQVLHGDSELEAEMTLAVHRVVNSLSISPSKLNDFRQGTLTDAQLSTVISYFQNGWPHLKKDVSQEAQIFWDCRQTWQ